MSEQVNLVREGMDRFNAAFERIDDEVQRVGRQVRKRRKDLEKQLTGSRKTLEKRTRKQVDRIRGELRRNPVLKRIDQLRADAEKAIESGVDGFLGVLQIASKNDLSRIDRRISQLNRKLKDLERLRSKGNGAARA